MSEKKGIKLKKLREKKEEEKNGKVVDDFFFKFVSKINITFDDKARKYSVSDCVRIVCVLFFSSVFIQALASCN